MQGDEDERLQTEVSLLETMFPGEIIYDEKARDLKFNTGEGSFNLRLPHGYLRDELPEVLSATVKKRDVRDQLREQIQSFNSGEETLDSIVSAFNELVASSQKFDSSAMGVQGASNDINGKDDSKCTIVVWLHHLLNTNKRKQALSPSSLEVSGVTKPGYPGVLVYSGPAKAVSEHVNELKQLNWQAFQVRLETDEEWTFNHGKGVKEVEAMKEVVADIGEGRKEAFMEAMRMK